MVLQDEIRCRLAEVFPLKQFKIDHVVHGAIASIITYGTLIDASVEHIESAVGMFIAHYIPFRAIRAGKQLSDSKGASAALSTEAGLMCLKRSMDGFVGPKDIFRNPEAIFKLNIKTGDEHSPFDLQLGYKGDDFAIMRNHFKLGLYEHQSAGAIQGLLNLILKERFVEHMNLNCFDKIRVQIYNPAFDIICKDEKKNPQSRQSADHSLYYILASLLLKAIKTENLYKDVHSTDQLWKKLILLPEDYSALALKDQDRRNLMARIEVTHGGPIFDSNYPNGIPTNIQMFKGESQFESGLVMFPAGHAGNTEANLRDILDNKFQKLGQLALTQKDFESKLKQLESLESLSVQEVRELYKCDI